MSPEIEPRPKFVVDRMSADDIEPATLMRFKCWLDTYVNAEHDITPEWIEECFSPQLSSVVLDVRKQRLEDTIHHAGWVAKDSSGEIIGSTTPYIDDNGKQDIGSLYIKKEWRGRGVANELMQESMDWLDKTKPIELCVVDYNDRAKAFYRKWGFEEVPDSVYQTADKIPTVIMIRKGDETNEI